MAHHQHRLSAYSVGSDVLGPRPTSQHSTQVSTTTLLNTLHSAYTSGEPTILDASTSLVVNTWLTASEQGRGAATIDSDLGRKAWEHARRRAEDGCIVLSALHDSAPSVLVPFLHALPIAVPNSVYTTIAVLRAFTCHVTPQNAATARYGALAVTLNLALTGDLTGVSVSLAQAGVDVVNGLLSLPETAGYRAFDVFYFLLTNASTPAEREFLSLKNPSAYALLSRSGTYDPPSYLPAADDAAAAEDFRAALKALGIKGAEHRNLISILAGLLKLGDTLGLLIDGDDLEDICEDVGGLLGIDPEILARKCSTDDRNVLMIGLHESLLDWILLKANAAIRDEVNAIRHLPTDGSTVSPADEDGDAVSLTILDVPRVELGKALALRGIFDDTIGINAEMKEDGVEMEQAGASVLKEMHLAVADSAADLGLPGGPVAREREHELDRRETILERVGVESEEGSFLRTILYPTPNGPINVGRHGRFDLSHLLGSSRIWYHLSIYPTDELPATLTSATQLTAVWSAGSVSRQLRAWRLPEWANCRCKHLDFTADFEIDEFATRYSRLGCAEGRDGVESWILERGWSNGEAILGHERVWIREPAWWHAESMLDLKPEPSSTFDSGLMTPGTGLEGAFGPATNDSGFFPPLGVEGSRDNLLQRQASFGGMGPSMHGGDGAKSIAPTLARTLNTLAGDYGLGAKGDTHRDYEGEFDDRLDPEMGQPKTVETQPVSFGRRVWVFIVWLLTFWIPSPALRWIGRMKRPDVRMAWREKVVLMLIIFLINAIVVFYIVAFGRILCPNFDKAWNVAELGTHQGENDFYVAVRGQVFDISSFWMQQHSDVQALPTTKQNMQPWAGQVLDELFPPPLSTACHSFVKDTSIQLTPNNSVSDPSAVHVSGPRSPYVGSKLRQINWYPTVFQPAMAQYYKGDLVWSTDNITSQGQQDQRMWFTVNTKVYDLTDYFNTINKMNNLPQYDFLPKEVTTLIKSNPGADLTSQWKNTANFTNSLNCLNNVFLVGSTDFRSSARCQVNNYILLAFTIVLCVVILTKFLSALQFGSKRRPQPQDKFVICQVPAYTEGEDQLRKALDSLTALAYDNKRKLLCVICDGMIVGGGNDRPTPKIVLDILGVDPKIDPPALPFKSVGAGNEQLNYGKVYSGLYEYEGNVVPYVVVVKVGKESEQTQAKPGNRGKRDSQILMLSFLNRVHHRAPMSPLELEMFHQINNIIGVDPELYEYLFMVDADTSVREDSLNRLVASCANDAKIAGICGETSLQNEERSWWTMIQVYEYYISHHLAKAFESLFGSVTCLPGCFCMYRLRTADKGRPLIISDQVIADYSDGNVDTLHKKNLLSLGEDRYLTTLMTKYFPQMSYKFVPDAYAATAAPETWGVLLSQRRRWINSTIHNLAELVFLKDLCGFCCFSMRFVVFIDLFGTIILPATCAYLAYLIWAVATHNGQFPLISIVMIAAVYGLQALIFILKRQWQHVGWMIIYICAYPVYAFVLPIYSFWKQDDFSWGNTRIVIGEKGSKQIVALADDGFDPRSIPLQRWDDYAAANNLPGRRGGPASEKFAAEPYADYGPGAYDMDDMQSMYSSVKPASTILTGLPHLQGMQGNAAGSGAGYASPTTPHQPSRPPTLTSLSRLGGFHDAPQYASRPDLPSMVTPDNTSLHRASNSRLSQMTLAPRSTTPVNPLASTRDLLMNSPVRQSPSPPAAGNRSTLRGMSSASALNLSRPVSTVDFRTAPSGPDEGVILDAVRGVLSEVDLDGVTKKQVRALVEQRLQTEIAGDKRAALDRMIDQELASM